MAASSTATATITIICCRSGSLGPPAPPKRSAAGAHRPQQAPIGVSVSSASHALRRACVAAAAACAVVGMTSVGSGSNMALALLVRGGGAVASRADAVVVVAPRWSDRRQCPPWHANSLENIVPENLPRPSAPRRFDGVSASAAEGAVAAPDLVAPPPSFLALRPGTAGCFSL